MIHIKDEKIFHIDMKIRKPIYEQIIDSYIELIIMGKLVKDEKIPSVRDLAKQLTINPNTVQKAYVELTSRGFFYTVLNKGNFVADITDQLKKQQVDNLYKKLIPIAQDLIKTGETKQDIKKFIEEI